MAKAKQIFMITLSLMCCVMLSFMFSACKISLGGGGNSNNNSGNTTTPTIEKRLLFLGAQSINERLADAIGAFGADIAFAEGRGEDATELRSKRDYLRSFYNTKHYFSVTKTTTQDENGNTVDNYDAKKSEILSPFFNDVVPYSSTSPIYFQYGDNAENDIAKWQVTNENGEACIRCYKKYVSDTIDYEFWIIKLNYSESYKKTTKFEYSYINSTTPNDIPVDEITFIGEESDSRNWTVTQTKADAQKIKNMFNQAQAFASDLTPSKVIYKRTENSNEYSYSKILPEQN
ncbi:MAG: hypothetical protein IJ837_02610 [Clostridia bacterium]|nr:hypothetical protein [Clostridia bacterium]